MMIRTNNFFTLPIYRVPETEDGFQATPVLGTPRHAPHARTAPPSLPPATTVLDVSRALLRRRLLSLPSGGGGRLVLQPWTLKESKSRGGRSIVHDPIWNVSLSSNICVSSPERNINFRHLIIVIP